MSLNLSQMLWISSFHLSADEDEEEEDGVGAGAEEENHMEQSASGGADVGGLSAQTAQLTLPQPAPNTLQTTGPS